jgi:signal transduction histidine kinase
MAKILVIDDRASGREYLVTLLSYYNHQILEAGDGREGLEVARSEHPALVITDILMPTMDGYEFVRQLRADPAVSGTPVIFYTAAYLETEANKLAAACGVKFLVTKPCEPQELLEKINSALSSREALSVPPMDEVFGQKHLHLLTNKLSDKVSELEELNATLENCVQARTAELAIANRRLGELTLYKDEMVTKLSDDLRSPLNYLLTVASQSRDSRSRPQDLVVTMETATKKMITIIDDLLDVSQIKVANLELVLSNVLASEVIRQLAQPIRIQAEAKGIGMEFSVAPGEPVVQADLLKLSQVFIDVLTDAVKYTKHGGSVRIEVAPAPGGVNVCVRNTYGDDRSKADVGVALTIGRQLVELHRGRISVAVEPGQATLITIYLPQNPNGAVFSRSDSWR